MLNLGVAFFVSCLNVFYEDIKYVATVVLGLLFYATPIVYLSEQIYQSAMIPGPWREIAIKALWWNPLSVLMITYRKILLPPFESATIHDIPMDFRYLALAALTSFLFFAAGYAFFNSRKWIFAEQV
jgi:ABC-type polysaccharide/polyol phosphate export permease